MGYCKGWNYTLTSHNYTGTHTFEVNDFQQGIKNTLLTFKGDPTNTNTWTNQYIPDGSSASSIDRFNSPTNLNDDSTSTHWASEYGLYGLDNNYIGDTKTVEEINYTEILGEYHESSFNTPRRISRIVMNAEAKEVTIVRKHYNDQWEIVLENYECVPNENNYIDFPTVKESTRYRIIITKDKNDGPTRIFYLRWWTRNFNNIAEFETEVQALSFRTLGSNKTLEQRILAIEQHLGIA